MFKKIVSIVIAVFLIAGMAAVAVHAADDGSAVGANSDDSAAIAAGSDDNSVGADDSGSGSVGGNAINFKADKNLWSFKTITCYLYEHGGDKLISLQLTGAFRLVTLSQILHVSALQLSLQAIR